MNRHSSITSSTDILPENYDRPFITDFISVEDRVIGAHDILAAPEELHHIIFHEPFIEFEAQLCVQQIMFRAQDVRCCRALTIHIGQWQTRVHRIRPFRVRIPPPGLPGPIISKFTSTLVAALP
ncbi:hypothetical protein D3C72_1618750 [compost metagenome]